MRGLLVLGLLVCGGCTPLPLDALIAALNERQITSCVSVVGSYGPFVGVSLLTATGGATLEQCRQWR